MSDTLILNADGSPLSLLPISAVNWHLSIKFIWLDKFKVLEYYDDWISTVLPQRCTFRVC